MALVAVAGALANKPRSGGEAWVRMSWVEGLRRLGFDVVFVEQAPRATTSPEAIAYFEATTARFGLEDAAGLLDEDGGRLAGLGAPEVRERLAAADALANISGNLTDPGLLALPRVRAYVDLDPAFTQIWHAQGAGDPHLGLHDAHFTVGENIGAPDCPIPTGGLRWRPLPPPVVLDDWPVTPPGRPGVLTTVATWRNPFGGLHHDGVTYPSKHHEWRRIAGLPDRVPQELEIALDIHPGDAADRSALLANGWTLRDPHEVVADADAFRRYVQDSGGELSVANGAYVETNSGWVSDRSVRYLASGRPVIVQDTGFGARHPTGEGLFAFRTPAEAAEAARDVAADPARHARAARALAEEHFAADRVLGRFCEDLGVAP